MSRFMLSVQAALAVSLFLASSSVDLLHAEDELVVRATCDPESKSLVGQRVKLKVDVLAKDLWASLPRLPNIDVPGAILYVPPSGGARLNEQISGDSFTGQQYEFWIYPQRQGRLLIPSLDLKVLVKAFGLNAEERMESAKTEPLSIDVQYPKDVSATSGLICVSSLVARQTWDPSTTEFSVGDGVTRTITRSVEGAPGMLLAPIDFGEIDGVVGYPKQPGVDDKINRGSLTGSRTDRVTYVFDSAGVVTIPSVKLTWWDVDAGQLRTELLEGLELEITPSEVPPSDVAKQSEASNAGESSRRPWRSAQILAGVIGLIVVFRKPLYNLVRQTRSRYNASEYAYFRRFLAAASRSEPRSTLRTLTQWWDKADKDRGVTPLVKFVETYGSEDAVEGLDSLYRAIDSDSESWQCEGFIGEIQTARRAWLAAGDRRRSLVDDCLPAMNGTSERSVDGT